MLASNSSGESTFFFVVNFAHKQKTNGVISGDTKQLCVGKIQKETLVQTNFIFLLTMTDTIISQNIDPLLLNHRAY